MNDLHRIFSDCLKYSEAQWPEVLQSACGQNHSLRAEVEKLLEADRLNQQSGFLEIDASTQHDVWGQRLRPGQTIGGYHLLEVLGSGGFGIVFKAKKLNRLPPADQDEFVAVKVLQPWHLDPSSFARFRAEGFLLQGLSHSNIANWIDTGTDDGIPYLVMEYIDGQPLHVRLRDENGKLNVNSVPLRKRVEWIAEVCEGLTSAHGRLILHRDLKPGNVLINRQERAIITDFGLAKYVGPEADDQLSLTSFGRALGTMRYMAPEQFIPKANLGLPTDVYGLGGLLYFVLTGRPPHELPSVLPNGAVLHRSQPIAPRSIDPTIPKDLEIICLTCLNSQPVRRYSSAEAVQADLNRFLDGHPISARSVGMLERAGYWCRRRPRFAALLALVAMGALISVATIVRLWRQSDMHLQQANYHLQVAEQRNDDLLALIGNLTNIVRDVEFDPATVRLQRDMLQMITEGYDQIQRSSDGLMEATTLRQAGVAWFKLGRVENQFDNILNKMQAYQRAEEIFRELVEQNPDEFKHRFDLYHSLTSQNKLDKAMTLIESIVADDGFQNPDYLDSYSHSLRKLAEREIGQFNFELASKYLNEAKDISSKLAQLHPQDPKHFRKLGQVTFGIVRLLVLQKKLANGHASLLESIEYYERSFQDRPPDDGIHFDFSRALLVAAGWNLIVENMDTAQQYLERADFVTQSFLDAFPQHREAWRMRQLWHQIAMFLNFYNGEPEDFRKSREDYEACLRRRLVQKSDCWRANSELAWLISDPSFTAEPDVEMGWKLIQQAIQNPSAEPMHELVGLIAFRRGDFSRTLSELDLYEEYRHPPDTQLQIYFEYNKFRIQCQRELKLNEYGQLQNHTLEVWQKIEIMIALQFHSAIHIPQSFAREKAFLDARR
jgi:serine/threonine protein kinase